MLFNVFSNLVSGFSIVVFQVVGTRIVLNYAPSDLAFWALAISLAGFAPLFAFNLNTAVARLAIGSPEALRAPVLSIIGGAQTLARRYLKFAAIAGGVGFAVLPALYPAQLVDAPWWQSLGMTGLFLGSCWVVLAQPWQGVLISRQQNGLIARATILGRALALCALWASLWATGSMVLGFMACGLSLWLSYWLMRHSVPEAATPLLPVDQGASLGALQGLSKGFAIWSVVALIFQASLVPLIGIVDANSVPPVYLAVTLMALLVGVVNAATGALIAPLGRMAREAMFDRVFLLSVFAGLGLFIYGLTLVLCLPVLLALWVGNAVALDAVQPMLVLIGGLQCVRLSAAVSSVVLMTRANNRQMILPSSIELVGLMVLAFPAGFIYGVPVMLLTLVGVSALAACATIVQAALLAGMPLQRPSTLGLLAMPLSFALATLLLVR